MQITRSSIDTVHGPSNWFTGNVYIDAVAVAPPPFRVTANLVHFMPGARTHWHRHPLSQTVFVTEGVGLCQRRGGPVEKCRAEERTADHGRCRGGVARSCRRPPASRPVVKYALCPQRRTGSRRCAERPDSM